MVAARLVPKSDGYADYVSHPAPPGTSGGQHRYAGRRRGERAARQRSIRSTITILLVVPLLSLIGLWLYAATSTVGGAMAEREATTVNTDIGGPLEGLIEQLAAERADTFLWQSADGRLPRAAMLAQRPRTDAAIAALRTGTAAAFGAEPSADRPAAQALLDALGRIGTLRTEVDVRMLSPLAAFQAYNALANGIYPFAGALFNPEASIHLYQESQALLEEGESADDIGQQATLMGGALVSGDRMSAAEQRVFAQTVDNQRLLEQLGDSPLDWQESPDPYSGILTSSAFDSFAKLQNEIIATPAGAQLRVSPAAWQTSVGSVTAEFTAAETAARLGVTKGDAHASDMILLRLVLVGGAGLVAVVISLLLLLRFGNRISRELTGLRGAALALAEERLPSVVRRLRAGDEVDVEAEAPPLALRTRTKEVSETAGAFSAVQRTAVEAAVEQARLRKGVSLVFRSLARRNQSLLQRQLKMLDGMERGTDDPDTLAQLFKLDHLTTRMRRQAEGLIILSGAAPGRAWRQPVPVIEVLRGALGEIEDFTRVDVITDSPDFLKGAGVADVTHLLAELVENAVLYSPPGTRIQVRCGRVANGYAIEVEDRGLGIPGDILGVLNDRLARPPEFDLADSDQLGLFVVSRLAARHAIKVSLRASADGGVLAVVLLPHSLVVSEEETVFLAEAATQAARAAATAAAVPAGVTAGRGHPLPAARAGGSGRAPGPAPRAGRARTEGEASSAAAGTGGLPQRQPMASMAPQLREVRPTTPQGPLAGRSPDQARALLSSIRQGWRNGLGEGGAATDEQGAAGAAGQGQGTRQDRAEG